MAQSAGKILIEIDLSSETLRVVGGENLDAVAVSQMIAVRKDASYKSKYSVAEGIRIIADRIINVFKKVGFQLKPLLMSIAQTLLDLAVDTLKDVIKPLLESNMRTLLGAYKGSDLDSHRLILFAGKQGSDFQHNLVEELFTGYFTQGKFIGDRDFLLECANKVGLEGAAEYLDNPNNGLREVNEELGKYSANNSGVPHYGINGKHQLSGGQPSEVFLKAFQVAAN